MVNSTCPLNKMSYWLIKFAPFYVVNDGAKNIGYFHVISGI
jgi:hypothetical protein